MSNWKTTLFGSVAAAAGSLSQVPGISPSVKLWSISIAAASGALFAFFCADAKPSPSIPASLVGLAFIAALCYLLIGCTGAGFRLGLKNTPFGSAEINLKGVAFGRPAELQAADSPSALAPEPTNSPVVSSNSAVTHSASQP
jgi:hypothetical protein